MRRASRRRPSKTWDSPNRHATASPSLPQVTGALPAPLASPPGPRGRPQLPSLQSGIFLFGSRLPHVGAGLSAPSVHCRNVFTFPTAPPAPGFLVGASSGLETHTLETFRVAGPHRACPPGLLQQRAPDFIEWPRHTHPPLIRGKVGATWSWMTQKVRSLAGVTNTGNCEKLSIVGRKHKTRAVGSRLRLLFLLAL